MLVAVVRLVGILRKASTCIWPCAHNTPSRTVFRLHVARTHTHLVEYYEV